MIYQERTYREEFNKERFHTFAVQYLESDILVGVDHAAYNQTMLAGCLKTIKQIREILDSYGALNPEFLTTHNPLPIDPGADTIIKHMMECGIKSDTGPMASVAGLFAVETARALIRSYEISEMLIENGGDIYLVNKEDINLAIFAGSSPLSNKLSVEIPPGEWGISTSSGTVGHSHSYGKADALTVICKDPVLSDAWATSLANMIKEEEDMEKTLAFTETITEILGCIIIFGDKIGVRGIFNIRPVT